MTISGFFSLPETEEEWQKLVQDVLDRRSHSYVQAALMLAQRFVNEERMRKQLFDNLSSVQQRCSELLEDRRTLVRLIEQLSEGKPEDMDKLVGELLTAAKAMR
jgi:hypothetical protein